MIATAYNYRFALALLMALALHAALLVAPRLELPDLATPAAPPSLDVLLVQARDQTPPEDVDFLAPISSQGGNDTTPERPEAPPTARDAPAIEPAASSQRPVQPPPPATVEADESPPPDPASQDEPALPDASRILQESLALARAHSDRTETTGPRRKTISANTREHAYAAYMRNWVLKVERVGNNNYPEQARRQNLEGSLILRVDIRADGSVDRVALMRSSGHDILDQAALRIVDLAAPYSPLPPDIASEVDILTISRTWQFSSQRGWQ